MADTIIKTRTEINSCIASLTSGDSLLSSYNAGTASKIRNVIEKLNRLCDLMNEISKLLARLRNTGGELKRQIEEALKDCWRKVKEIWGYMKNNRSSGWSKTKWTDWADKHAEVDEQRIDDATTSIVGLLRQGNDRQEVY